VEHEPIEFADTFAGDQVALKNGRRFTLSALIAALDALDPQPDWGHARDFPTTFQRLSALNPHLRLSSLEPSSRVTSRSNLVFDSAPSGATLRIFLPLDVADRLVEAGHDWFRKEDRLRFDFQLFSSAATTEQTALDRTYMDLVKDIGRFGYTIENRTMLSRLVQKFEEAARFQPTLYRRFQAEVIAIHEEVWASRFLDNLAASVTRAYGPNPEARYADQEMHEGIRRNATAK
jgi:hypothetical protein